MVSVVSPIDMDIYDPNVHRKLEEKEGRGGKFQMAKQIREEVG